MYLGVIISIFLNRANIVEVLNGSGTLVSYIALAVISAIVGFLSVVVLEGDDTDSGLAVIFTILGLISLVALLLAYIGGLTGILSHLFRAVDVVIFMIIGLFVGYAIGVSTFGS